MLLLSREVLFVLGDVLILCGNVLFVYDVLILCGDQFCGHKKKGAYMPGVLTP